MFVDFNILNQLGSPSINSNTFANRPAAGQTGRLFVSTDTFEIYRDNGTTWDLIGGPGSSTITGTGTATQVAYFTSSQAIGSSANLFWDNTSGFLGVGTATPSARIEAVKTDGVGIYANFTTNAGSGSSTTALWAKNVTNSSGYAAVIEESTPNTTAGQYPLLIKHSLSSGTAGIGMGTGLQFQLPDDAGTFKTTQLTIETINAAAATYATRYRFNVQNNGSSLPVAYINSTGLGIFTATPGAALDIHSTGVMAQLNSTSATANSLLAFQRSGSGLWRIGDVYNGGPNYFELYNTVLGINAMQVFAATNKTSWQATENYTSGVARGNYFDYNLTLNPANPLASPNAISAVGASLDLTLEGSITIPSGARSGLDAYNSIGFTTTGTLTHNQGTQIRAYSNLTAGWAFNGSATGTITHLAGLRALFPDNTGSAVTVTNNYALLLNDQTANTGTVTYTNRWGVYQEGASDLNYMAANLLLGSTTNNGNKLQVTGNVNVTANGAFGQSIESSVRLIASSADNTNGTISLGARNQTGTAAFFVYGDLSTYLAGPVGIGTTAPLSKLQVNTGTDQNFRVRPGTDVGATNGVAINSRTDDDSALQQLAIRASDVILLPSNNVGINTNTPTGYGTTLQITSTSGSDTSIVIGDGSGTTTNRYLAAKPGSAGNLFFGTDNGELRFVTQLNPGTTIGNTRGLITSGGNFLIGTTTDNGNKLQVNGQSYFADNINLINSQTTNNAGLVLKNNTTGGWGISHYFNLYGYASSPTAFFDVLQIMASYPGYGAIDFFMKEQAQSTAISAININGNGKVTFGSSIKTSAPNTGTAAEWKLGSRVAATVVVNTTEYIEVDIGGTLYKLATVT
jgi:hypothetical protein